MKSLITRTSPGIRRQIVCLAILMTVSVALAGQPALTWTELRKEFPFPAIKYRPVPLWFWNNTKVTPEGIDYQMKAMRDSCHYGGVSILPFGKNFQPEYLSESYFDLYRHVVEKATELGMGVCIYDEYGFPSGSGGWRNGDGRSRFAEKYPGLLLKGLDKSEFPVKEGTECVLPVATTGKLMGIVAMEEESKKCIDITSQVKNSFLVWKVPPGKWRVIQFYCHDSDVLLADYLDPEAIRKFIDMTHNEYFRRYGSFFGKTIYGTFFDEPTLYHAMGRVWTGNFNDQFENKYGYSPVKYYPALWYDIGPNTGAARNLLFGFRSELYAKGFTKTIDDWNRLHNVVATGHQDNEEVENPVGTSGDLMKCFKYLEAPGIDKIFGDRPAEKYYKVVASSAYNWDKTVVMSETFGGMGISIDSMYKVAMDQYVKGINQVILHAYWYDSTRSKVTYLPELSERNPLYKHDLPMFSDYLSRMQLMLRNEGSFMADAAVLYPISQMQAEHYFDGLLIPYKGGVVVPKSDYAEVGRLLSDELGVSYLFIHPEVLDEKCSVGNKNLLLKNSVHPQKISLLIVPSCRTILLSNLKRIKEFYDGGGSVIFTTQLPEKSAEAGMDEEVKTIIQNMLQGSFFRENLYGGTVEFLPVVSQASLAEAIARRENFRSVEFMNGKPLRYLPKNLAGKALYYFTNPTKTAYDGLIRIKKGAGYETWNPYTGQIKPAEKESLKQNNLVRLRLAPGKSVFVIEK